MGAYSRWALIRGWALIRINTVTIKRLTRYKQKVVLEAMLQGKSMPSNMAANTNRTTLLKNQSAIKYLL